MQKLTDKDMFSNKVIILGLFIYCCITQFISKYLSNIKFVTLFSLIRDNRREYFTISSTGEKRQIIIITL